MSNSFDPKHSLTGNEFLDFLSWCEVQGIDFEGKEKQEPEEENQDYYNDEDNDNTYIKERKR